MQHVGYPLADHQSDLTDVQTKFLFYAMPKFLESIQPATQQSRRAKKPSQQVNPASFRAQIEARRKAQGSP